MNDQQKVRAVIQEWNTLMNSTDPLSKWDVVMVAGQAVGLLQRLTEHGVTDPHGSPQRLSAANVEARVGVVNVPAPVRTAPHGPKWDSVPTS